MENLIALSVDAALQLAPKVTTALGLCAFLGALIAGLFSIIKENSVRHALIGPPLIKDKIIEVLKSIPERDRLAALTVILDNDKQAARSTLAKVEKAQGTIFTLEQSSNITKRLIYIGITLVVIAAIGYATTLYWPLPKKKDESSPSITAKVTPSVTGGEELVSSTSGIRATQKILYRYWSDFWKDTYLIADANYLLDLDKAGWKPIGNLGKIYDKPVSGSVPLYQFWSEQQKDHFCTIDEAERSDLKNHGWLKEEIIGFVPQVPSSLTQPLYKLTCGPDGAEHYYFFTLDQQERAMYRAKGCRDLGIAWQTLK